MIGFYLHKTGSFLGLQSKREGVKEIVDENGNETICKWLCIRGLVFSQNLNAATSPGFDVPVRS